MLGLWIVELKEGGSIKTYLVDSFSTSLLFIINVTKVKEKKIFC